MSTRWGRWPRATVGAPREPVVQWTEPAGTPATLWPNPGPLRPVARPDACCCAVGTRSVTELRAHVGVDFEGQRAHDPSREVRQPSETLTPFELAVRARCSALVVAAG